MERLNKFLILFFAGIGAITAAATMTGCGVKGVPLPPLTPAPIGRGEPTYSEATQKSSKDNKKKYKNTDVDETPNSEIQEGL